MRTVTARSAGGVVVSVHAGAPHVAAIRPAGRPDGHWALPKGTVEDDEAPLQTALREVREETGLICEAGDELAPLRYFFVQDGVRVAKQVRFWLMTPLGGEIDAIGPDMRHEVHEARWLPLADAAGELLTYPSERSLVDEARQRLGGAA